MNIKSTSMKREELDLLLSKYYDGLTTPEEEKTLKVFFSGQDVPEGYEPEKAIFGYYSGITDIPEPSVDFDARILTSLDNSPSARTITVRKITLFFSGIAASIIILMGTWFFLKSNEPVDTFSDPHMAYAETMKILMEVSLQMNKGAEALNPVSKMNLPDAPGIKVITNSRETLGKQLQNLEYVSKIISLTGEKEKDENN